MTATAPVRSSAPGLSRTWRRRFSLLQDALLVCVSALFAYLHAHRAIVDGTLTAIPFAIEQGLLVGMFLTRRRSFATSTRPLDWLVASGSWLPLVMQPQDGAGFVAGAVGTSFQWVGLSLTVVVFLFLGKSFGVVAANRGLKVGGPYRLVRHPIYFSHTVTMTGFIVANFHPLNVAIFATVLVCQVFRMNAEERVLGETSEYSAYRARVRWRIVPGVY